MKKNLNYIQTSILFEVLKHYTSRDVADIVVDIIEKKDTSISVYESHDDAIVFRKKKDGIITDDDLIKAFAKSIKKLVNDPLPNNTSLIDEINDNYEFEYDDKYVTEGYLADVLEIRRSGRLISVEIDL